MGFSGLEAKEDDEATSDKFMYVSFSPFFLIFKVLIVHLDRYLIPKHRILLPPFPGFFFSMMQIGSLRLHIFLLSSRLYILYFVLLLYFVLCVVD